MFGIEKILGGFAPKKALAILAENVASTVGHAVDKFEVRMFVDDSKTDFLVYLPAYVQLKDLEPNTAFKYNNENRSCLYKYKEGDKLCKVVSYAIQDKLPDNYQLQYLILKYEREKDSIVEAYGLKEGNIKEKQTIII